MVIDGGGMAPIGNRAVYTVADQMVSSGQSLFISLVVTHSVGLTGVGAFAIAFVVYQILSAINRPLNGDPLTVGFSAAGPADQRVAFGAATGGAMLLGLVAAAVGVGAGMMIEGFSMGPIGPVLIAFALGSPAILLQDAWRCVFFTAAAPARALVNDVLVLIALPPACFIALKVAPHSAAGLVAAWCAATAVGAGAGAWQAKVLPDLRRGFQWWRSTMHFGAKVLGENLISNFAYSAGLTTVAVVSSVASLGRLRTAQVASNAANPLSLGLGTIVLADGTRLLAHTPERFPRLMVLACTGSFLVASGISIAWYALPTGLGTVVVGSTWPVSRPLVLGAGAYVAGSAVTIVLSAGLRAMRFPATALKTRALIAPVTMVASVTGAALWGPGGAIGGIAAAEWLYVAAIIPQFRAIWLEGRWRTQPSITREVALL